MMGVFVAVQIENISTENGGRSESVVAGSDRSDLGLIFLEADFHVSVALVPGTVQVLGAFHAVAAFPIEQLAVYIPHRVKPQLEIARGPGHLKIKIKGEERPRYYRGRGQRRGRRGAAASRSPAAPLQLSPAAGLTPRVYIDISVLYIYDMRKVERQRGGRSRAAGGAPRPVSGAPRARPRPPLPRSYLHAGGEEQRQAERGGAGGPAPPTGAPHACCSARPPHRSPPSPPATDRRPLAAWAAGEPPAARRGAQGMSCRRGRPERSAATAAAPLPRAPLALCAPRLRGHPTSRCRSDSFITHSPPLPPPSY